MTKKIIEFNNDNDIKKFEKKINLYKSIFFKKTIFVLKNNTSNNYYNNVIEALNIKDRKKRIEYIYDKACEQIDTYNKEQHIDCLFKNGKCMNQYGTTKCNGCCRLCYLQTPTGCKSKNLSCKLFFCDQIKQKYKILKIKDIKVLKCLSIRNKLIIRNNFFSTREDFLKTLYIGSITFYSVKVLINIIKLYIFSHKNKP